MEKQPLRKISFSCYIKVNSICPFENHLKTLGGHHVSRLAFLLCLYINHLIKKPSKQVRIFDVSEVKIIRALWEKWLGSFLMCYEKYMKVMLSLNFQTPYFKNTFYISFCHCAMEKFLSDHTCSGYQNSFRIAWMVSHRWWISGVIIDEKAEVDIEIAYL